MPRGGRRPGAGRPKGALNMVNREARAVFQEILNGNAPKAQEWFDKVAEEDPAKALDLLLKLSEYFMPKMSRTELTVAHMTDEQILEELKRREAAELPAAGEGEPGEQ